MTRETKIGLLVGLAFIIVIGVLLSDYIQSSTQPQQADFIASSGTVRQGVEVPGAITTGGGPVRPPVAVEPTGVVVTQDLLNSGVLRPDAQIRIGPGGTPAAGATPATGGTPAAVPPLPTSPLVIGPPSHSSPTLVPLQAEGPSTQGVTVVTPEAELARLLVSPTTPSNQTGAAGVPATSGNVRTHVAVAGDTVYRMTQRYYGGFTPARAELIVKANPSMGGRADRIIVGQTYIIPPLPVETATAVPASPVLPVADPTLPPAGSPSTPAARPEARPATTYTVRPGDSLWRIADRTGVSVAQLKQANRDTLRGSDVVRPGMVLRVPAGTGPGATAAAE